MTHAYGERAGVRFMTNGLKVYYIPRLPFYEGNTFPTIFGNFRLLRVILIREQITVVHAHQTVFTDHSLFGFADGSSIHTNKLLKFTLADTQHVICVSHTSKANTVLRSRIPPPRVSVIPNAVDTERFLPGPESRPPAPTINVVVISRLVYRKGSDLLIDLIPMVCKKLEHINFIVGGDGPKKVSLDEMVAKHGLGNRVEMLGNVTHADVRNVLVRGHIFLNTSLTEAFCIAILEAASCGLLVVSTRVGGVPEVLPSDMLILEEPQAENLCAGIERAVQLVPTTCPFTFHDRVKEMYDWKDITRRVQVVYARAHQTHSDELLPRLARYYTCGRFAGKLFCCVAVVNHLYWGFLEWMFPRKDIDLAPDVPSP
eukprot:gene15241-18026_t